MRHPETQRSLRRLAHRLRHRTLAPSELPDVPLLLQRLDLRDHDLFDDFCATAVAQWQELSPKDMAKLFRNTEHYHLLHSTKGTALCRLVASLEKVLDEEAPPRALAALCHGSLAARRPLPQLRAALQSAVATEPSAADTVELLGAAGELHRAIGVGIPTLKALAARCQQLLGEAEVSVGHLSLIARASGRLALVLPLESRDLFEALIAALQSREEADRERVFPACRQLPANLRRLLAESGLLRLEPSGLPSVSVKQIETRLHLMHDLPLYAAARGEPVSFTDELKALLTVLQEAEDLPAATAAAGYMAAATVVHSFVVAEASDDAAEFRNLAQKMLEDLHWEALTPREVQILFRTPGDALEASSEARKNVEKIKDPHALAALLQASNALLESDLAEAARAALMQRIKEVEEVSQLSLLEAATRKGPIVEEPKEQIELRQSIRGRLFKAVHEAPPAFDKRPNRGFIRYVEKCMAKDRRPPEESAKPLSTTGTEEVNEVAESAVQARQEEAPTGVTWHTGVKAWEATHEVGGRRVLGGYFKAAEEALDCHKALKEKSERPRRTWSLIE